MVHLSHLFHWHGSESNVFFSITETLILNVYHLPFPCCGQDCRILRVIWLMVRPRQSLARFMLSKTVINTVDDWSDNNSLHTQAHSLLGPGYVTLGNVATSVSRFTFKGNTLHIMRSYQNQQNVIMGMAIKLSYWERRKRVVYGKIHLSDKHWDYLINNIHVVMAGTAFYRVCPVF